MNRKNENKVQKNTIKKLTNKTPSFEDFDFESIMLILLIWFSVGVVVGITCYDNLGLSKILSIIIGILIPFELMIVIGICILLFMVIVSIFMKILGFIIDIF